MRTVLLYLLFLLTSFNQINAQSLQEYISEGLENNVALKEKNISIDKAMIALKEAKSLFQPATHFEAQYTLAKGGRSIDMPVGDLLNPVYKALNQIIGTDAYPIISNVSEQLLPNNFYDARLKTVMPIFNQELRLNNYVKTQEINLRNNDLEIYKRELVKDIKIAYYNYLMAAEAIRIIDHTLIVANQNLKVNQSLIANGKSLPAYESRALYQVQLIEAHLQIAHNGLQNAKAYFNFLLNRPLQDTIIASAGQFDNISFTDVVKKPDQVTNREELRSMTAAININNRLLKMNRSFRTPKLNSFIDIGVQDFDFKVNNRSFFYLAGLQLQVPIFSGNRNNYKIRQTMLDQKNLSLQWEQVNDKLMIAATVSYNNLKTAYNDYRASISLQEPATKYYQLIALGYKEGINSFIEFLDASKQLTEASLQLNINRFKLLSAKADYERQTATYTFQ